MKRIIIILIIFNIACYVNEEEIKIKQMHNYTFENEIEVNSAKDALEYVASTIKYKSDEKDYWQSPEETYLLKTGDCEDFALLLAYLLYEELGFDNVMLVRLKKDGIYHIIVKFNDMYFESETGKRYIAIAPKYIQWEAHYTEAIWMTVNYHNSVGKYY